FRSLFYALLFGMFAILLLQDWQTLNRAPALNYSESSIGGIPVQIWTPERLLTGNARQQEIKLVIDEFILPENTPAMITLSSPNQHVGFSRTFFNFENGLTSDANENNKAAVYYNGDLSPTKSFTIQAEIKIGTEQRSVSHSVNVESFSRSELLALSAALAGLIAALNLANQIRSLIKENRKT
ncbi:MAG: hypothetical protein NT121_01140, partial [Chloroflexi bacterium]|nr:hypothetical protein [Chloroflexota bacterium]